MGVTIYFLVLQLGPLWSQPCVNLLLVFGHMLSLDSHALLKYVIMGHISSIAKNRASSSCPTLGEEEPQTRPFLPRPTQVGLA